jgi:pimeloyl-ACP methyl ester carboxylesterase
MGKVYRFLVLGVMLGMSVILSGCGSSGNTGANAVGNNFVSATVIDDINASVMLSVVKAKIDANATNAFGYKAIKIVYKTTNENGDSVNASGMLVLPTATDAYKAYLASLGKSFSISAICDNHGTIFLNSEAPTSVEVTNGMPDSSLGVLMTGFAGFAAILPDYLGYGDSQGQNHPYIMKTTDQASLDMIRASVRYMTDNHIAFNGQLYISGYSEGGYVAMDLAKDIQENYSSEFNLKGVAPMAGPYDVEALGVYDLNTSSKMVYPAFLAYIADSYSKAYSDINISDLAVKASVFSSVDLFGGNYDAVHIHVALGLANGTTDYGFNTHFPQELLISSFISDFQSNFNNILRVKFAQNSIDDWTPNMKMNMIQCVDDEIIPFAISTQKTYSKFIANGATAVSLTPIPSSMIPTATPTTPFVHQRCGNVAYGAAVKWFDNIRSGAI